MEQGDGRTACLDFTSLPLAAGERSITGSRDRFGGYRADLHARYDEYMIAFNATIDDEMSLEQFRQIVVFFDDQLQQNLSSK